MALIHFIEILSVISAVAIMWVAGALMRYLGPRTRHTGPKARIVAAAMHVGAWYFAKFLACWRCKVARSTTTWWIGLRERRVCADCREQYWQAGVAKEERYQIDQYKAQLRRQRIARNEFRAEQGDCGPYRGNEDDE